MKPTMRYREAIGLALVIAAALGGWAGTILEHAADPEIACVLRPSPGSVDESLWNLHCAHVAEMRALSRPTQLAGQDRAIPSHARPPGAEPSVIAHPSDELDCLTQAPADSIAHLKYPNASKPELGSSVFFTRTPCERHGLSDQAGQAQQ